MPITQTQAALFRLSGDNCGRDPVSMMPQHMREKVEKEAAARGVPTRQLIDETADAGDDKDRRIALLEAHILHASDCLAAWLSDNTEEVFEEQPEIDNILTGLRDGCS